MIKFEGFRSEKEPVGINDKTISTKENVESLTTNQSQTLKLSKCSHLDRREDQVGKSSNHSDKL